LLFFTVKSFNSPMKTTKFIEKRYKSQLESKLSTTHLSVSSPITVFFGAALRGEKRGEKSAISACSIWHLGVRDRAFLGFGALQLAGFSC
jgi:hypothetical protein